MIKTTLICRASDGLPLCEVSDFGTASNQLQETKHQIKKYQKEVGDPKDSSTGTRQIESASFGIFFRQQDGVMYTVIADLQYPARLASLYLDCIIAAFADELKSAYGGAANIRSRLETIENSHHFIKFDRVVKQKKVEYEDVQSSRNLSRMKSDLESIKDIVKVNMDMINGRAKALEETEDRARRLKQDAEKFKITTSQLKWQLWFKSNLFWLVLFAFIGVLSYMMFL